MITLIACPAVYLMYMIEKENCCKKCNRTYINIDEVRHGLRHRTLTPIFRRFESCYLNILLSFGVIGNTPDSELGDGNVNVGSIPTRTIYFINYDISTHRI